MQVVLGLSTGSGRYWSRFFCKPSKLFVLVRVTSWIILLYASKYDTTEFQSGHQTMGELVPVAAKHYQDGAQDDFEIQQ